VEVQRVFDRTFLLHIGGKIEVSSKVPLRNRDDLSMAYTPGVLQTEWIQDMATDPVVFALANPDPEVDSAEAGKVPQGPDPGAWADQLDRLHRGPTDQRGALLGDPTTVHVGLVVLGGQPCPTGQLWRGGESRDVADLGSRTNPQQVGQIGRVTEVVLHPAVLKPLHPQRVGRVHARARFRDPRLRDTSELSRSGPTATCCPRSSTVRWMR
jgi:hypothetical protein